MDPLVTVLKFGSIERPIGSYGLMLALAVVVVAVLSIRAAARNGLDVGAVIAVVGLTGAGAAAGAWMLFVGVEWLATGSPRAALAQPGLVFLGAVLGGWPTAWVTCRRLGLPFGRLLDGAVPAVAAAHAVGRLGCFLGGCCYGREWDGPWAVRYTHPIAPAAHPALARHPTPLYEAAGLLVLAFWFASRPPSTLGDGRRMLAYLALYGTGRIAIEFFRGDAVRGVFAAGWLSTSQVLSAGLVAMYLAVRWWDRATRPARWARRGGVGV